MRIDEIEIPELNEAEGFCLEGETYLPVEKQAIIEGWRRKKKRIEEVHFWRRLVVKKSEEKEELRIWYNEQINELLEERVVYTQQIRELIEEKEALKLELEMMKAARDRLEERVAILFKEAEEVKVKKKFKKVKEKREKKRPGAKIGHKGWYRPMPENIDEVIEETLSMCPYCGSSELSRYENVEEHVMEDIVPARIKVTKYRQHYYWCKGCKRAVTKQPDVIKNGRLGPNIISYAAKFKHDMKLPYEKISELLNTLCGLKVTGGGLAQLMERSSKKVEGISEAIIERIKHSLYVHGDETGWRLLSAEKINQWLMCFCNIEAVYYQVVGHRNSEEVRKILGEKIGGVFISDFCSCYNKLIAKKQRCLIHVLRDIKNYLEEDGSDHIILTELKEGIGEIIEEGLRLQKDAGTGTGEGITWQVNRQVLTELLDRLCQLQSEDENARRLIKRLNRFKGELLTFIDHPEVEYHNNRAERMLRPMVVSRKISYGSQTEKGANATCIMMSILQTCRLRGVDFEQIIRDAITGRVPEWLLIRRLFGISRSPP